MTSLADFLMRNKLDALGEQPEYTTADVNALMPQQPSWDAPAWLKGIGSAELAKQEPNALGHAMSYIPAEALHALNFLARAPVRLPAQRIPPDVGLPVSSVGKTPLHKEVNWALDPMGEGRMYRPWPDEAPTLTGMSEAQRAAAEAAGYDTSRTLYRGSSKRTADPLRRLKEGDGEFPYFTDKPRIAEHYASGELHNPSPAEMVSIYAKEKPSRYGPNITPAWALRDKVLSVPYGKTPSPADVAELRKSLGDDFGKNPFDIYMETIAEAARRKGYNMVEFQGMSDWGGKQSQYLPLHPDAIRSPWAKFGPGAKPGSFVGGLAPAIAAPALATLLQEEEQQQ
jgi:hypothetical protein